MLNPIELTRQLRLLAQNPLIATNVELTLLTHHSMKFISTVSSSKLIRLSPLFLSVPQRIHQEEYHIFVTFGRRHTVLSPNCQMERKVVKLKTERDRNTQIQERNVDKAEYELVEKAMV